MKVLEHAVFGQPEDVLELLDLPLPEPGRDEVVVELEAAPIHAGDLKNIAGEKTMIRNVQEGGDNLRVDLPQVPGIEGVGHIIQSGPDVTRYKPGDRVLLPWQCGSWRTHICVPAKDVMPAPAHADAVQLSLMVNAFTAYFALTDLANLKPGDWFVQNGANSNVGRILIRLAHMRGIRTVNIIRRPELIDDLKPIGADVIVLDGEDMADRVRSEAGRNTSLRIGLDTVSGDATARLAACLSDGATVANMGMMSGEPCHMPMWILHYKRISLIGYYAGHNLMARSLEEQGRIIAELADGVASGHLEARIAATYPLDGYREAVRHAAQSGSRRNGKVVFLMQ